MRWVLAFHIIFVVTWFAGLFYLPRLFVYHANAADKISVDRFCVMERKLYYYIMMPSAVLASAFGLWLLFAHASYYSQQGWMHAKLLLVMVLWIYHIYCGYLCKQFANHKNRYSHRFYRWFNEVPSVLLIVIVILVIVQP